MYSQYTPDADRKPSKANSRRKFKALATKVRPGLAVDTNVIRHRGQQPRQVFPYESKTEELVSQAQIGLGTRGSIREQIENRLPVKSVGYRPLRGESQQIMCEPAVVTQKKSKGLKPAPLTLKDGVSLSSLSVSNEAAPFRSQDSLRNGGITPSIIITPAREGFGLSESPDDLESVRFRPTSSVYSRYTNGAIKSSQIGDGKESLPPVPPLPLFSEPNHLGSSDLQDTRASATTVFEERDRHRSRNVALSVCTGFEDASPMPSTGGLRSAPVRDSKRVTRQSHLPTPMRNKGWWNVITSPFSAGSAPYFWRSPRIDEEGTEDAHQAPAMREATKSMGFSNPLFGRIFNGRKEDDDALRSAPADHMDAPKFPEMQQHARAMPKRSFTAPSALDQNAPNVNIYRIPSQGEAAAYYDARRHFPSLIISTSAQPELRSMFSPDTPYNPTYDDLKREVADLEEEAALKSAVKDEDLESRLAALEARLVEMEAAKGDGVNATSAGSRAVVDDNPFADFDQNDTARPVSGVLHSSHPDNLGSAKSPFDDVHEDHTLPVPDGPPDTSAELVHQTASRAVFASPSPEELATPMLHAPAPPAMASPPLSPSPVVEHAHMAHFVGPTSYNGEQREVDITSARTPVSNNQSLGLAGTTMHSRPEETSRSLSNEHLGAGGEAASYYRPTHSRQSSYGLGISGGHSHNNSETQLFPQPQQHASNRISEKFTLGTDRFRQLTLRSIDEPNKPYVPWYRRFFWLLVATASLLFLLLVVLLVTLIPQHHSDVPVQAQWMNLTGFPALPTGIATVIEPKNTKEEGSCVQTGLWTCSAASTFTASSSKTRRDGTSDTQSLPNFRLEIRFRNGTTRNNTALMPQFGRRASSAATMAGSITRAKLLKARSEWTDYLFSSLPSPPSQDDQTFLGQTTDDISEPYDGIETPFFISLLDAVALSGSASDKTKRMVRRDDEEVAFEYPYPTSDDGQSASTISSTSSSSATSSSSTTTSSFTGESSPSSSSTTSSSTTAADSASTTSSVSASISSVPTSSPKSIPKIPLRPNGKPMSPTLYSLPSSQPLRLYNQGQDSEHYGFYTYYDRSIFVSSSSLLSNSTSSSTSTSTSTSNSSSNDGSAFCTFSQTRLHVQIWTRRGTVSSLSGGPESSSVPAANSSANDMIAPGSFPYPVTVTIDRHGGEADKKGVFCYAVDDNGNVIEGAQVWVDEDRSAGGKLTNPAEVPTSSNAPTASDDYADSNETRLRRDDGDDDDNDDKGGIDGGSGGCGCAWTSG